VVILSSSQYGRYRSVLKRVSGHERRWMHHSLVAALGGFTVETRRTHVLFCRDSFEYPELEEHPYLCNHLGRNSEKKKAIFTIAISFSAQIEGSSEEEASRSPRRLAGIGIGQFGILRVHVSLGLSIKGDFIALSPSPLLSTFSFKHIFLFHLERLRQERFEERPPLHIESEEYQGGAGLFEEAHHLHGKEEHAHRAAAHAGLQAKYAHKL